MGLTCKISYLHFYIPPFACHPFWQPPIYFSNGWTAFILLQQLCHIFIFLTIYLQCFFFNECNLNLYIILIVLGLQWFSVFLSHLSHYSSNRVIINITFNSDLFLERLLMVSNSRKGRHFRFLWPFVNELAVIFGFFVTLWVASCGKRSRDITLLGRWLIVTNKSDHLQID